MIVELVERASTTSTYFIYSAELSFSVNSGRPAKTWRDVWSVSQIHNPIDPAIEQALFFVITTNMKLNLLGEDNIIVEQIKEPKLEQ